MSKAKELETVKKGNRIVIVLPMYGQVYAEWIQHFLKFQQSIARFNATHKQDFAGIISTITPYVDIAMNELVTTALSDKTWDYMVNLEQDNIAPAGLMDRIWDYDPDVHKIVGTLYFGRVQEDQRPIVGHFTKGKFFDRLTPDETEAALREPGLYPVDWVGMGCTAIHRSVFEGWDAKRLPWFKTTQSHRKAMGHDVHFCTEARRQGLAGIFVDTREVATHMGMWKSTTETYLATRRYNKEIGVGWDPSNISTAMTAEELTKIAELAKGKRVLEIGARVGASTVHMAKTAQSVHSVDWHKGDKWHDAVGGSGDSLGAFWATVNFHNLRDKVYPLVGSSQQILPTLADAQFDFIFIDGDHSYEGVMYDVVQVLRLLKPGGVLAFHDYDRETSLPEYKDGALALGITKALDEFLGPPPEVVGTLAIYRDPQRVAVAV